MKQKELIKLITYILVPVIIIGIILLYNSFKDNKKEINYIEGITHYQLAIDNSTLESNDYKVLKSYEEYISFINKYEIEENLNKESFNNSNYIYYIFELDSCSESIKGVSNIIYKNNLATITIDTERSCGVCAPIKEVYFIPISKNENIEKIEIEYNVVSQETCNNAVAYKPILYLYPDKDIDIEVKLKHEELLLTTYPKYQNGWQIHAKTNGDIYDEDGNYYYALYWEEKTKNKIDFKEGFYVTKENAITFLEEKLKFIGLSPKERNEFIMYWLPILEKNEKNLVYFEQTEQLEKNNQIIITPKPTSLLRVHIHIKKVNKFETIKEQTLIPFTRKGYTAVEWGGVIH